MSYSHALCVWGMWTHAKLSGKRKASPWRDGRPSSRHLQVQWRSDESFLMKVHCALNVLRWITQNDKVWASIQGHISSFSHSLPAGSRRGATGYAPSLRQALSCVPYTLCSSFKPHKESERWILAIYPSTRRAITGTVWWRPLIIRHGAGIHTQVAWFLDS